MYSKPNPPSCQIKSKISPSNLANGTLHSSNQIFFAYPRDPLQGIDGTLLFILLPIWSSLKLSRSVFLSTVSSSPRSNDRSQWKEIFKVPWRCSNSSVKRGGDAAFAKPLLFVTLFLWTPVRKSLSEEGNIYRYTEYIRVHIEGWKLFVVRLRSAASTAALHE